MRKLSFLILILIIWRLDVEAEPYIYSSYNFTPKHLKVTDRISEDLNIKPGVRPILELYKDFDPLTPPLPFILKPDRLTRNYYISASDFMKLKPRKKKFAPFDTGVKKISKYVSNNIMYYSDSILKRGTLFSRPVRDLEQFIDKNSYKFIPYLETFLLKNKSKFDKYGINY